MQILINGDRHQVEENSLTISQLLMIQNVESPDMVSVQINGNIIDRSQYSDREIFENDEIDFLYFMGGGAKR